MPRSKKSWPKWVLVVPVIKALISGMTARPKRPGSPKFGILEAAVETLGIRIHVTVNPNFQRGRSAHRTWKQNLYRCLGSKFPYGKHWDNSVLHSESCKLTIKSGNGPTLVIRGN